MAGVKQPSDKSHFILPDLGEGLVEAELISWKVSAGDTVKEQQTLAEMQTDKALVEVPSPWAGTVSELCGNPGDIIKVGAVLLRFGAAKPAAALLGISRTTLDALVRKGEIRAVRLGGRVLFAVAELERVARGEGGAS